MTCIVGVVAGGKVLLGSDSITADGYTVHVTPTRKVCRAGEYVFGFTTSWRMGQILKTVQWPKPPKRGLERFVETSLSDFLRKSLNDHGWGRVNITEPGANGAHAGGNFLIGVRGLLFEVCPDYGMVRNLEYATVGAAQDIALGALFVTRGQRPRARIRKALKAASTHNMAVRPPWVIVST